jgi:hypothetical protein
MIAAQLDDTVANAQARLRAAALASGAIDVRYCPGCGRTAVRFDE